MVDVYNVHIAVFIGIFVRDSTYRPVQGLSRGLAILRAINRASAGWATITDIAQATGLHRTTVRRMLETLQREGYVRRSASDDSYRLNLKVRELSEGFTDDAWIAEIATPVLGTLLKQTIWPSDLCTLNGDCMLVRETTHRFSALSFHRGLIRLRMPILFTAAGRAFLAHCGDNTRESILGLLQAGNDAQAAFARNRPLVAQMIERTRRQGWATNDGDWASEPKIAAVAMPIRHRDDVLGSINVVYLRRALSAEQAAERLVPPLRQAVQEIERQLGRFEGEIGTDAG